MLIDVTLETKYYLKCLIIRDHVLLIWCVLNNLWWWVMPTGTCFIQKIYAPSSSALVSFNICPPPPLPYKIYAPSSSEEEGAYIFWMKQVPVVMPSSVTHSWSRFDFSTLITSGSTGSHVTILKHFDWFWQLYLISPMKSPLLSSVSTSQEEINKSLKMPKG
jgi:hypothetical protein